VLLLCAGVAGAQRAAVVLPTEWSIPPAPATEAVTGTLPQGAALTADGSAVIVADTGAGEPALRVFDATTLALKHVIAVPGAFGTPLADKQGGGFWAATGNGDTIIHAGAVSGTIDRTIALPKGFWPAAIARSPDGRTLAVSGESAGAVATVDLASGIVRSFPVGQHPSGVGWSPDGSIVYAALWGEDSVALLDLGSQTVRRIHLGRHPEAIAVSPDGRSIYVTIPDDDAVAWLDAAHGTLRAIVNVGVYAGAVYGASPSAAAVSSDGKTVFVVCSAANAIAVLHRSDGALEPAGAIRTGWYPTAIAMTPDGEALLIVNGKGDGSSPNPAYDPYAPRSSPRSRGYVATTTFGSLWRIAMPFPSALAAGLPAIADGGGPYLRAAIESGVVRARGPGSDAPGRAIVRAGGPIKHVIYVIKENRTYDQVLGDIREGDGDGDLALFGERITPNEHAIARRFGLFDRAFADAQVSADGHTWSTAAFANDYLEKMWPPVYGGRRETYDFEDGAAASVPRGGYIWNAAARAGVTLRNYGEFTTEKDAAASSSMADLAPETDPRFIGFDLAVKDADRLAEWKREFDAYVRSGTLPALEIVRLPNDHTAGTKLGAPTPQVYVAENDAAFGRLVDIVSHSRYWNSTAIFAIEDDAQNGPDHVSAQRTTLFVASPYARAGVHHARYSSAGLLRTIELILGLEPLSAYDAAALPLYDAFGATPDPRPYDALPARIDLSTVNGRSAYRASDSGHLNFSREDGVPDAVLNDIIWHAVRGAHATPPPYGAFSTANASGRD
jgi:DNA-binding beta-propeller fold protein YncE